MIIGRLKISQETVAILGIGIALYSSQCNRFDAIDAKFETVDAKFEAIDARFEAIDQRFDVIELDIREIRGELRDLNTRVTRIETLLSVQSVPSDGGPVE